MYTHTHTFNGPFSRTTRVGRYQTVSGSGISWTYASLHLAPDRQPRQHLTTQFFTGRMPFLPPNQQRQSTEGKGTEGIRMYK